MVTYWLTPLIQRNPLTLGRQRFLCDTLQLADFRSKLQMIHPRYLMVFKANTLLSDDWDSCGMDDLPFSLEQQQDIVFDGSDLQLSHCAEAFLERLPSLLELKEWYNSAIVDWTTEEKQWLMVMQDWNDQGYDAVLIKED